jgi:hypothetical protein
LLLHLLLRLLLRLLPPRLRLLPPLYPRPNLLHVK